MTIEEKTKAIDKTIKLLIAEVLLEIVAASAKQSTDAEIERAAVRLSHTAKHATREITALL